MTEAERAELSALTEAQREGLRNLVASRSAAEPTVGAMTPDAFAAAMSGVVTQVLNVAGAGRAVGGPAVGMIPETPAADPVVMYGEAARARFQFERSAEIRALPTQEARTERVEQYLGFTAWATALSDGDKQRADQIAAESMGLTVDVARQLTTTTGGASLVPTIVEGPIIEKRALIDKITPRAMQYRSTSGILRLSAEGDVIVIEGLAEAAPATPQDLTYDPITLTAKKGTAIITTSREVLTDAAQSMQLVQNFSRQAGRAFGIYNNTQNLTGDGTGTNYTNGILNGATAVTGTAGALTDRTFLDLLFAMGASYRDNLAWCMGGNVIDFASQYKDTNGARVYPNARINQTIPISGDANSPGFGQIEGIQVLEFENSDMATDLVALVNLDLFAVLVNDSIRVETTNTGGTNFVNDTQQWKFVQRQDAAISLVAGFVKTDGAVLAPV